MDSILSKIAEYTIEPIGRLLGRQVGYVIHCKTNLQKLKDQVEELKAARQAIENQVAEAKRKGEKIRPDVQLWLTKVDEITAQADELSNDESQAKLKCLHGFCPNLTARHQLSRKSTKLVEEVVEHCGKRSGLISQVSCGILRKEVWAVTNRDYHAFESRMSKVKEIMDHLKDSKTERMGVCGVGGVGKTTLVKEIYKQVSEDKKLFDDVIILLDVKKDPNLEAIQKVIVEKLGMEILPNETKDGRASRLCARIQDKKILVILDDVEEKINLEAVGLPRLPTCKILLTCRTRQVFDGMRVQKVFQLDLLGKEDTWNLFVKMAGDVIHQKSGIRDVAIKVAERCGGLPLLVVTVASALKDKIKLHAWKDALRRLKVFDKEELTEKAYLALEWSYDQLDGKELKPLFLLCGVIVAQNHIYVEMLLKYGLGLGLFKNVNTVEEAHNALDSLLEKLKDSCLLLDSDVHGKVRMHDLVCHVAKRIACRDHHVLSVEYGGELKEWPNKDFLRKCTKISLPNINIIPTLSEIPLECPELELSFWHCKYGYSVEIPTNFFREMQKLKVLDLSGMSMPSLPLSLQSLKNLRTLCLDDCTLGDITLIGQLSNLEILSFLQSEIKKLPKEIGQLTRLRLLDLSYCTQLEVISPTVISSLVRLEDLRMRNSFNKWETEGERSNASLSELKHLSELSALEIQIPNADILPANLFSRKLERFNIFIGDTWVERYSRGYTSAPTLNTLKLKLTKSIKELDEGLKLLLERSEDLSLDETEVVVINQLNTEDFEDLKHLQLQNSIGFTDIINKKVVFSNLSTLRMHGCDNLRFLFSFSMARSLVQLTQLKISACNLMQEIVSSTRECGEVHMDNMFSKLKILKLEELPSLVRFGTGNSEFSSLEELEIKDCDELVEFIGDKVAMSSKDTIICKEIEQRVLEEEDNHDVKSEIVVQYFLFNEKVGFPSLERLSIKGIRKVKAIWHVQLAKDSFRRLRQVEVQRCDNLISLFPPSVMGRLNASSPDHDQLKPFDCQNLDSINIHKCDSLKNIFPASMARGLQQLTQLNVSDCSGIVEIVCKEEEEEVLETTPPQFVFPKVTSVALRNLPQLRRFYPRLHVSRWPLLKEMEMVRCDKVEIFAAEFSMFQEKHEMDSLMFQQPLFITNKDSFPNLEHLGLSANEIWNGPAQSELVLGKLKSITFYGNCAPFSKRASILFIEGLPNLEKIEMRESRSSYEEIFVNRGISTSRGEIRDDDAVGSGTLPRVRILKLWGMDELMHLGNDNSQSAAAAAAGPVLFPNLEILEVEWCCRLKSLGSSSAISFPNLTTLTVHCCHGLEYLTTYSVAKSLVQLTTLKVRWCDNILVIVASNDEDDDDAAAAGNINEIAFSRLQHLELWYLPRLQGFCSGNCTVKFPSSMTTLFVYKCPIKLKISPDGVLLTEKHPEHQDDDETIHKS